jgi:hypothetical protein
MKVAVTGHTHGIGQGLYNYFQQLGHEVYGFSRSNGYTLPNAESQVLDIIQDFDIFVNNALPVSSQILFLKSLWPTWKTADKKIIVIGSLASHLQFTFQDSVYQEEKRELDILCKTLRYSSMPGSKCSLIAIHPGFVNTNIFTEKPVEGGGRPPEEWCLSVSQVVNAVDYALSSSVEIDDIILRKA